MNVLMLGPQGSGKGTQATRIAAAYDVPHIATGDLYRAAIAAGTELGKLVAPLLAEGKLVPDEITIGMLLQRLEAPDAERGVILDGFPRNRPQADALDRALADRGAAVEAALLVDVPADELLRRLSGRWLCSAAGHTYH